MVATPLPKYLPPEAFRSDGRMFAMVRLRNPDKPTTEWASWPGRRHPFVTQGYRTWTIEEWWKGYGNPDPGQATSPWWDFFGDPIDIWEGYSEE